MFDFGSIFDGLPSGVLPETIVQIDKVAQVAETTNCDDLATDLYKRLAAKYRGDRLYIEMQKLNIETPEKLLAAVDAYLSIKKIYPDTKFYNGADDGDMVVSDVAASGISDITLFVIDNIVKKTHITNRYDVMSHVCEIMEHRFGDGDRLEQTLDSLNLKTTKDVLRAVDIYCIMKKLYPDTVFGRKRMYGAWASAFQACLSEKIDDTNLPVQEAS